MSQPRSDGHSPRPSPRPDPTVGLNGFLAKCLMETEPRGGRRIAFARGKAVGLSALAQVVLLVVVLIVPLFAASRPLVMREITPIPPYGRLLRSGQEAKQQTAIPIIHDGPPRIWHGLLIFRPSHTNKRTREGGNNGAENSDGIAIPGLLDGDQDATSSRIGLIPSIDSIGRAQPPPPETSAENRRKPIQVSEGVQLSQLIHRVDPIYPSLALQRRAQGVVELRAIISREGTVGQIQVVSGDPVLAMAARAAVQQWRFRPTLLNGQPVEVETVITVTFHIRD